MMGFDFLFTIFPAIFTIMFLLILGMFIVNAVRGIGQWNKNNASPKLTVEATVTAKRGDVTYHHHHDPNMGAGMDHTTSSTTYYATFQVESGDRMEFRIPRDEYGYLAEGDRGRLTFQGTRYLGFERT